MQIGLSTKNCLKQAKTFYIDTDIFLMASFVKMNKVRYNYLLNGYIVLNIGIINFKMNQGQIFK